MNNISTFYHGQAIIFRRFCLARAKAKNQYVHASRQGDMELLQLQNGDASVYYGYLRPIIEKLNDTLFTDVAMNMITRNGH